MIKILMKLLKTKLIGQLIEDDLKEQITLDILIQLYHISCKHDISHIVGLALKENQLLGEDNISMLFNQSIRMALIRTEMIIYEQNTIMQVFENSGIDYLPLKGAVIRKYYPQQWMRTSCDIDILIRKEQLDMAKDILISKMEYQVQRHNYHDILMIAPNGIRLELHFSILEYDEKIDPLLEKVWDYVILSQESKYRYEMLPEFFMFHILAHMYYHFVQGGCGIRFFIDWWLLEQNIVYDEAKFQKLCESCKLQVFVNNIRKLTEIWFQDEKHDKISMALETYICEGGLYGNKKNKVTVVKVETKGRGKYILKRLFIPCEEMSHTYPRLKKLPFLYPYYFIKRWIDAYREGRLKDLSRELYLNKMIQKDTVDEMEALFKSLGI